MDFLNQLCYQVEIDSLEGQCKRLLELLWRREEQNRRAMETTRSINKEVSDYQDKEVSARFSSFSGFPLNSFSPLCKQNFSSNNTPSPIFQLEQLARASSLGAPLSTCVSALQHWSESTERHAEQVQMTLINPLHDFLQTDFKLVIVSHSIPKL